MKVIAVIPARYTSTRLPGKPLADICGKPMIQHVYERVSQVPLFDAIIVATDVLRIMDAVAEFGGSACMTSPNCASGSDRLIEVSHKYPADIYVNIQGDEPLVEPESLKRIVEELLAHPDVHVATLCYPISKKQAQSSNLVKVVRNHQGDALYFSRSLVPFAREKNTSVTYYGHLGVYAYRAGFLQRFGSLPPSPLEQIEKLEQLRILQAGVPIRTVETCSSALGVDTPEDLEVVRAVMSGRTLKEYSLKEKLARIKLIITDIDGIFTDGGLYYSNSGEFIKKFNVKDGLGIALLRVFGIKLAVLSGRDSESLRKRLADLDVTSFELGQLKKNVACRELIRQEQVMPEETLFIGDDLPDAFAFEQCGVSVTVADAPIYIRERADIVLTRQGGGGALRELIDMLIYSRGYEDFFKIAEIQKLFF